jgi:hypothetical protein
MFLSLADSLYSISLPLITVLTSIYLEEKKIKICVYMLRSVNDILIAISILALSYHVGMKRM